MAHWQCEPRPDRGVNELLVEGLRELGGHESTVVVAGGEDLASGVIDLSTPKLKADELRNALAFELRRSAPVSDEKLAWGYRVLAAAGGRQLVRLYYLRQTIWERWLDDVGGLVHGVDMVIPPAAALDPVLADTPVALGPEGKAFLFVPTGEQRRESMLLDGEEDGETVFGLGSDPLAHPQLDASLLNELDAPSRRAFTGCAVLAMYGLSRTFAADRRSGLELPHELRPRRHRHSRLVAVALLLYVLIVGGFGVSRRYQTQRREFARLHAECVGLERHIEKFSKRTEQDESKFMTELSGEIAELTQPRPTLAAALAEITRRVGPDGWCTAFRWRDGSISIQLRENQELEDLERILESSPLLGDVRQEYKKVRGTMIDRKIEMNARYDFDDEQSEPPPPRNVSNAETEEETAVDETATEGEVETDDKPVSEHPGKQTAPVRSGKTSPVGAALRKRFLRPPPPPPPPPALAPGKGG